VLWNPSDPCTPRGVAGKAGLIADTSPQQAKTGLAGDPDIARNRRHRASSDSPRRFTAEDAEIAGSSLHRNEDRLLEDHPRIVFRLDGEPVRARRHGDVCIQLASAGGEDGAAIHVNLDELDCHRIRGCGDHVDRRADRGAVRRRADVH
jgi:hypothetical protein